MENNLLSKTALKRHELMNGELVVYVREPTFLDMQKAAQSLIGDDGIDLSDYWRYAFLHWVDSTEPELSSEEMVRLNPETGKALSEVLPSPEDLVVMLGFSKAKPTSSPVL